MWYLESSENPLQAKTAAEKPSMPRGRKPSAGRELAKLFFKELGDNDGVQPLLTFASERRDMMRDNVLQEVKSSFPIEQGDFVLELKDAWVDEKEASPTQEREALLKGESLLERVRGHVVLRTKDGKVVDEVKGHTLAKLPFFTDDHSFILEGTHYVPRNQLRTRSGVFTRRRGNDDIEASFNMAKGANFRLSLEPEKARFNMEFGTTKIPLYPVLRALGKDHDQIAKTWGTDLTKMNSQYDKNRDRYVTRLYEKVIPAFKRDKSDSMEKKIDAIKQYFDSTQMDPHVNSRTLGHSYDKLSTEVLTSASKKLLGVFKGEESVDDRDSLEFQKVFGVEDFLAEKIRLDNKDISRKVKTKIRFPKANMSIKGLLPPNTFGKGVHSFITSSTVMTTPTNINPLERMDSATTITRLGEGAISSERAIPMEARRLHGSHLGMLGPLRTPESSRAGIDVRSSFYAAKDKDGILHTPVIDLKTNKVVYKSADELADEMIAFPEQDTHKGNVDVLHRGKVKKVKAGQVRYQVPNSHAQYSVGANLIPMLESVQGNRGLMASKMVTQAMPLVSAEEPLVQVSAANTELFKSMEEQAASMIESISPTAGRVEKVDNDFIHVKADKYGHVLKIPYKQNMPYAKTRFHQEPIVKAGDVVKPMQKLTKSNFTKNGKLALGTNLSTAYIADHGYNTDDAVSISETAAEKLTSEHMTVKKLNLDDDVKLGVDAHATHCPNVFTRSQYAVLERNGVPKKGAILKHGDPIFVAVRKSVPSAEDMQLGRMHKSLVRSHRDISETWNKPVEGEVIDVILTPNRVTITILSKEPAKKGDKIAGLYGNKGVIGRIVPDSEMVQGEDGKPVDLLFTSAGVISRINPAQITAGALGKAARKRGQIYTVKNFDKKTKNNVDTTRDELKKNGLDPNGKETLTDPVTGRKIPNIFVGQNYILKLHKTTDSNFAARNVGGYDAIQQPTKGGDTASKSTGNLEVNALLAHNARGFLSDVSRIKSQQNGEYWRSVQLGHPPPPPNKNFAFSKFQGMLQGAGIKVSEKPDSIALAPMTDADVARMSSGEIKNEKRVRPKDLKAEKGGLFDPSATGGPAGNKWAHIELAEPMINPVFFEPARRLLGKTKQQMEKIISDTDGSQLREQLNSIDVKAKLKEMQEQARRGSGAKRDNAIKQAKYLRALDTLGMKAGDAYTLKKFPVIPPSMRPILPAGSGGSLIVDDANFLYRDLVLSSNKQKELKSIDGLPPEFVAEERKQVFQAMSAVAGLSDPISPQSQTRKAKGFIRNIAGTSPKFGYFQSKVIKRKADLTGSATVALNPNLGVDEVEIPEEIGWRTYQPFIVRRLIQRGMKRRDAIEAVENKTPLAKSALLEESKYRPMVINRAPSLHRFSMLGVTPKFVEGKTIRVNPYLTKPMNMDFDGDVAMLSVPATEEGRKDVNNMRLSKQLFSDKERGDLLVAPQHEAIFGWTKATEGADKSSGKSHKFSNLAAAVAAYKRGELKATDLVEFGS